MFTDLKCFPVSRIANTKKILLLIYWCCAVTVNSPEST